MRNHPSERIIGEDVGRLSERAGLRGMAARLACHAGPSSSKQNSSQASSTHTQTATDDAVVVSGGTNVAPGAAATGGASSPIIGGSQIVGGSGGITITSTDAATLEKGLETIADLAGGFGGSLTQVLSTIEKSNESGLNTQQANLSSVLGSIAALSESRQTGGASDVNKNILYVILGLLTVVGLGLYFFRKR